MKMFNCVIVDDEPFAREIIQSYCSHLPNLKVVASYGNAIEAREVFKQFKIDILFLDVNMPVLDGMSFLKTLKDRPQVIFTTAYKEFATDAFDLAACDYLLKPFSLERFIIAVDKALEKLNLVKIPKQESQENETESYIFIKTGGKIYKIKHDDLLFAEANGNYTKIITTKNTLQIALTFSDFEKLLPGLLFLRVHRSFIINKSKISHVEGNRIFIEKSEIPIGSNYKERFLKELGFPK
jgi:two-component system, LytTR family, response regulator